MLLSSIVGLFGLFVLNLVFGMRYGFGFRHYWFFETLHLLGGFFVAMFLASFIDSKIFIFIGLATISFLWEITEYLIGKNQRLSVIVRKNLNLKNTTNLQSNWRDTMFDIILNFTGAAIFIYIIRV